MHKKRESETDAGIPVCRDYVSLMVLLSYQESESYGQACLTSYNPSILNNDGMNSRS